MISLHSVKVKLQNEIIILLCYLGWNQITQRNHDSIVLSGGDEKLHNKIMFSLCSYEVKKNIQRNIILLCTCITKIYFDCVFFHLQLQNGNTILLHNFLGDSFGIWVKCTHVSNAISKSSIANSNIPNSFWAREPVFVIWMGLLPSNLWILLFIRGLWKGHSSPVYGLALV